MTFAARSTCPPVHPCSHPSFCYWLLAAALAAALAALEADNGVNAKVQVLVRIDGVRGRVVQTSHLFIVSVTQDSQ